MKRILLDQYDGGASEFRDLDHLGRGNSYSTALNAPQHQTDCATGSDEYQDATDDLEIKAFAEQAPENITFCRELCKEPAASRNLKQEKNEGGDPRWPAFLHWWSSSSGIRAHSRYRAGSNLDEGSFLSNNGSKMDFQAAILKSSGQDLTCLMGGQNSVFAQDSENPSKSIEFSFRKNIRQVG